MASVPSWDDFVEENLLHSNLFCGVCLLSQLGDIVYTFGQLTNLSEGETRQFLRAFQMTSQKAEQKIMEEGFTLTFLGEKQTQFKIYSKTFCR
ncbi:hypothetical protein V1264_018701 [Littorina saxatilis]|uniref:Uncharacterized protein n=1 Tax=Littorina saxatilis TaxID=31220 RepID=A0AAN9BF06_9CAEN